MSRDPISSARRAGFSRAGWAVVVALLLAAGMFVAPAQVESAEAQGNLQLLEVWSISGGLGDNPKEWRYRQSSTAENDLGSVGAADPNLDDSSWGTRNLRWKEVVGLDKANHFRKDFDLADLGIEPFQVVGIRVQLQYDDAAVMYLNGTEVYRSIRGNLPDFNAAPLGSSFAYNVDIPFGGQEEFYVQIPDPNGQNVCEEYEGCTLSPYGSPNPPAISADLLVDGTNTWGITTWNRNGRPDGPQDPGSGDSSINHVFELLIDEDAIPPATVFINEVMADNDSAYLVELDGDPDPESPDWFELRNASGSTVNLGGWTIADATGEWTFPASASIPGNGYLVVAANDGDDGTTTPMQTSFKLSSSGDSLKLTTADGIVSDEYTWTDQFEDNSMGRSFDFGGITYLESPTPGQTNAVGVLTQADPVLRTFRDRIYNPGESVELQIDAFDPDGDDLSYSMSPTPTGISIDSSTGLITGTADYSSDATSTITVSDSDGDVDSDDFVWIHVPAAAAGTPIMLNEYNAVPATGELNNGSPQGNGGDWFEFLIVEDNLDLRGWAIELRQRDGDTDELRDPAVLTFADSPELAMLPAGTIVTIGEDLPGDIGFDGNGDWHVHLQVDNEGNGEYFEDPPADTTFNSTRRDQTVVVRNADGQVVAPLSGESEAWDDANGGVSGGEVMGLCISPTAGTTLNPVTDYKDNGTTSTFGLANQCVFPDPANPAVLITQTQDLGPLRASATFGTGTGDVNCDGVANIVDALMITQYDTGVLVDTGPCLFDRGGPNRQVALASADVNDDGRVSVVDALIIASCEVGLDLIWCDTVRSPV